MRFGFGVGLWVRRVSWWGWVVLVKELESIIVTSEINVNKIDFRRKNFSAKIVRK